MFCKHNKLPSMIGSLIGNPSPVSISVFSCFHNSSLLCLASSADPGNKLIRSRNTSIKKLDPSEYENTAVGKPRLPLPDRRGEQTTVFKHLRFKKEDDKPGARADMLAFINADIDLRPTKIQSVLKSINAQADILDQAFKPERVRVLGADLSAAHFILFRKGRVKFMGHNDWIGHYRKDAHPEDDEDDLPALKTDLCTLPTHYDPNWRLEAIDASNVNIRYEGLMNFDNLNYLSWLSFRNCTHIDDWCLDRIYGLFHETLEYLDISNCKKITGAGLTGAWKLKNLKTLVVEDMAQIKNLEVICAQLEEQNNGLVCIGIDFEKKLQEIKQEQFKLEQTKLLEEKSKEENTIEVIPVTIKPEISSGKESKQSYG